MMDINEILGTNQGKDSTQEKLDRLMPKNIDTEDVVNRILHR